MWSVWPRSARSLVPSPRALLGPQGLCPSLRSRRFRAASLHTHYAWRERRADATMRVGWLRTSWRSCRGMVGAACDHLSPSISFRSVHIATAWRSGQQGLRLLGLSRDAGQRRSINGAGLEDEGSSDMTWDLVISSPEDMELLGSCLAAGTGPGDVVCLSGDLGAGETKRVREYASSPRPAILVTLRRQPDLCSSCVSLNHQARLASPAGSFAVEIHQRTRVSWLASALV